MELLEYWPGFLQELLEFRELAQAEQPELDSAAQAVRAAPDDFFISTLSPDGAARWERMLGFPVAAGGKLTDRRFRVMTKMNEQRPFTMARLRELLESLCGEDGYSVVLENEAYTLTVRVALTAKQNFTDVGTLLERAVPVNLVLDVSLLYNQHETLGLFTYAQLTAYSHDQLRNEVLAGGD